MEEDNITRQLDEVEALKAIYGDDFHLEDSSDITVCVNIAEGDLTSALQVTMPSKYPSESPPIYTVSAPWLKGPKRQELLGYLEDLYLENIGESMVYTWAERIRQFMATEADAAEQEAKDAELKTMLSEIILADKPEAEEGDSTPCPEIFSGEVISDRKSHFQPHLAEVRSQAQVKQVLRKLKENRKIANAIHNMYAYRFVPEGSTSLSQDCDDDGEDHAGGRMLHLLQILDAQNVIVIVTRWFGGILLGPDRFKHINNAARQILEQCGHIKSPDDNKGKKNKKGK